MRRKCSIIFCISLIFATCTNSENLENDPIAKHPDCKKDVQVLQNMCEIRDEDLGNNWAILDCIDSLPDDKQISESCDNHVWKFKLEVTKQDVFLDQAKEICGDDVKVCSEEENSEPGHFLACLVEKKHETKSLQCGKFLSQVENIIFSDYRIISTFMNACDKDISKLKCGKTRKSPDAHHSQGGTIQCLSENMEEVEASCKKEILTIAELQADDYHLDRALYLACKNDREEFCPRVQPGDGRVYKCLMKNKMSVSQTCQEQLVRRQQLISQDFKVDGGLVKACKEEIKHFSCRKGVDKDGKQTVKLAQILLCLEGKVRDGEDMGGKEIGGVCINEMREIRRELMEDYSISPELVANCAAEIEHFCAATKTQRNGKTIHCLMKAAMDQSAENQKLAVNSAKSSFSKGCESALDQLVKETQVLSDWQADPVLEDACDEVVAAACDPKQGSDAVMSCLMEQLSKGSDRMTTQCSEVLMQVHYFLAREILIDEHLYKSCNKDAVKVCNGAPNWHQTDKDPRNQLVFPCLVRNLYADDYGEDDEDTDGKKNDENEPKLSEECTQEVERTLRQRAMSVQLHPEIEEDCRNFLHTFCTTHTKPGEELGCLQENFKSLEGDCQKTVSKYTRIEAKNPFLHPIISKACSNLIERKCGLEAKAQDGSGVMECLVRHKMEHALGSKGAMNTKCRTVVEQWQILTLQDWRFSFKFKEACKDDIREHCTEPRPKKKQDVIECLVLAVASDTAEEEKHRIKKACRAELKFELLQKHSNVKLDPVLEEACGADIEKFCEKEIGEDGGLECLKSKGHDNLSRKCKKVLFQEEKEEAEDNDIDFALMRGCKREIKEHCADEDAKNVLQCLKDFSDDSNFDLKCLKVIGKRIIQHAKDYRLNPSLADSCKRDIPKFCGDVLNKINKGDEEFYEGHVIACLKQKAIQKHSKLSDQCRKEIMNILSDSAKIVDADPVLEQNCPNSLAICRNKPNVDTGMKINECLKEMFEKKTLVDGELCNKHLAQIIEGTGADIHADPVLHNACAVDLRKFCRDVPQGEGRMFGCLVSVSREEKFSLEPECKTVLTKRIEMYDLAVKVAPLESAQELIQSVMKSPHRNYLVSTGMMFLGMVFVFGLCFGRVTKRLRNEIKNR
eukprot:GFUD01088424.1.p1 GENE.GFUD01088424.1~~GFUD01088424.1.p1  ORF type:complete len:1134 (-),score=335.63 GFUD01088424.1:2263-5664(-)